jgi:hypothetical protein
MKMDNGKLRCGFLTSLAIFPTIKNESKANKIGGKDIKTPLILKTPLSALLVGGLKIWPELLNKLCCPCIIPKTNPKTIAAASGNDLMGVVIFEKFLLRLLLNNAEVVKKIITPTATNITIHILILVLIPSGPEATQLKIASAENTEVQTT